MKKIWVCIFAIAACLAQDVVAQKPAPKKLKDIESYYQEAKEKGLFEGVIKETRKEFDHSKIRRMAIEMESLQKSTIEKLTRVASKAPSYDISRRINRLADFKATRHQKEALRYFLSLKYMPLNYSHSPLENQLIAIDIEYDCKILLVEMLHTQRQIPTEKHRELKADLNNERFIKMKQATSGSTEHAIARYVDEMVSFWPTYHIFQEDWGGLQDLFKGTNKPLNSTEEQIKKIMTEYISKIPHP